MGFVASVSLDLRRSKAGRRLSRHNLNHLAIPFELTHETAKSFGWGEIRSLAIL